MSDAFNPIKGPFDTLPEREPGTVVVAVGSKGAVSLQDGERLTWGERVFGGYKAFYLVDISTRTIRETYHVPSSQQAFSFNTMVSWDVAVSDPRRVIEKGIRDLGALLDTLGRNAVVRAARGFTVQDIGQAESAVWSALMSLAVDPAVKIVGVAVEMRPDDEALKLLRTVQEEQMRVDAIHAKGKVEAAARAGAKDVLSSPEELLAQILVTKDEGYKAELQRRLEQASSEHHRRFEILKALIENKIIEPLDFHKRFPDFLNDVFKAMPASVTDLSPRQVTGTATQALPQGDSERPGNG